MSTPALFCLIAAAPLLAGAGLAAAQATPKAGLIYTCDVNGKKVTSDRPIPECNSREQRVLNKDGSTREVRAPVLTADERAEQEARQQQEALAAKIKREAVYRDRNLLQRFPNVWVYSDEPYASLTYDGPLATIEAEKPMRFAGHDGIVAPPAMAQVWTMRGLHGQRSGDDPLARAVRQLCRYQELEDRDRGCFVTVGGRGGQIDVLMRGRYGATSTATLQGSN